MPLCPTCYTNDTEGFSKCAACSQREYEEARDKYIESQGGLEEWQKRMRRDQWFTPIDYVALIVVMLGGGIWLLAQGMFLLKKIIRDIEHACANSTGRVLIIVMAISVGWVFFHWKRINRHPHPFDVDWRKHISKR